MTTPIAPMSPETVQVGPANGPGLYLAAVGTAAPATMAAAWATGWEQLGWASDDGVTLSGTTDTEDMVPWQSPTPLKTVITGRTLTAQFSLWSIGNPRALALYFGQDVPTVTDNAFSMDIRSDAPTKYYSLGIDSRDGERGFRVVFHRCTLSDTGDMPIQRGSIIPLDVTLSALDQAGSFGRIMIGPATTVPLTAQMAEAVFGNGGGEEQQQATEANPQQETQQ